MPKFVKKNIAETGTSRDEVRDLITPDKRVGRMVPIDEIRPNPEQPRKIFDEDALNTLTESIEQYGLINPITVDREGVILAGERRYRACVRLGLKEVPVIRMNGSTEISLVENLQRQDLHPLEESKGYQALIDAGYTHEQVAHKIGKDRSVVSHSLRLLDLPADIQAECVTSHNVTKDQLLQVLGAETPKQQWRVWDSIKAGKSARAIKRDRANHPSTAMTPRMFINRVKNVNQTALELDMDTATPKQRQALRSTLEVTIASLRDLLDSLAE